MHNKLTDHIMRQHTDRQSQKRGSITEDKKHLSQGDVENSQAVNSILGSDHNPATDPVSANSDKEVPITKEHEEGMKNENMGHELNKRNFYLSLFHIYSSLPFSECLASFTKIFNDVFVLEKPLNVQKYFLTECQVVEMNESFEDELGNLQETHSTQFSYNFAYGTSRCISYNQSVHFRTFLNRAIREVKKHDSQLGEAVDLHKRGRKAHGAPPQPLQASEPQNGHEFFFSNVMVKIYQLPMLFSRSSEEQESVEEGCFMVLIFEKQTRKRSFAKTQSQLVRLTKQEELKKQKGVRYFEELLYQRDSKMRRFCNYFVTLFNQKKINPFTQFVGQAKLKEVK